MPLCPRVILWWQVRLLGDLSQLLRLLADPSTNVKSDPCGGEHHNRHAEPEISDERHEDPDGAYERINHRAEAEPEELMAFTELGFVGWLHLLGKLVRRLGVFGLSAHARLTYLPTPSLSRQAGAGAFSESSGSSALTVARSGLSFLE